MDGDWWLKQGHPTSPKMRVLNHFSIGVNGLLINHHQDLISVFLALFVPLKSSEHEVKD